MIRNQGKILLLLSFALIAFAYFIWQVYATNNRLRQTRDMVNRTYMVIQNINDLFSSITVSESATRAFAITGDSVFVHEVQDVSAEVYRNLDQTKQLVRDSAVSRDLVVLEDLIGKKLDFQMGIISGRGGIQPIQQVASLRGKQLMDSIQTTIGGIRAREQELLQIRNEQNTDVSKKALLTTIIGSLVFFIFIALILWRLSLDMQRRIRAEKELQQFRYRFQAILDNTPLHIFLKDLDGRYILVNKSFRETFGFKEEQIIGKTDFDFESKMDAEKYHQSDEQVIRTRKPVEQDEVLTTPEGNRYIHYIKFPVQDQEGKVFAISGFGSDITERKEAESKLRASEEKMRALLNSTKEGFFLLDVDLNILLMNESGKYMMQLITGQMAEVGESMLSIVARDRRQNFSETIKGVLEGNDVEFERGFDTREGHKSFLINYLPVRYRDNEISGVCVVCRDITDLVRYREQLIEARRKAERAEKLQEQFLANMSHEIRTPLNGIIGMTNLLLQQTQLSEDQHEYVNIIKYSSDNLSVLINDILDFSKIKAGKLSIENIEFNIWEVAQKAVASLQPKAKEKDLGVLIFFHPNMPPRVKGDPHRLNQVLNNLLSNAIKFTQQGYVRLEISLARETETTCRLQFNVKDSGIGIAEDKLAYIFESFSQAGEEITRKYGGTGLGLTITKQLIELQKGSIDINSQPGKGTTISFEIPYEKIQGTSEQETSEEEEIINRNATLANKKILIVEDNEVNQKVVAYNLEPAGVVTTIANNGREAVDLLESGKQYDLIIMDLQMPVMNGFQAAAYIRQKLRSDIPIIAMTASALRNEQVKCFELGMNEYVTKPFAPSELFRLLEKHLDGGKMRREVKKEESGRQPYSLDNISIKRKKEVILHVLNIFLRDTGPTLHEIKEHSLYEQWDEIYQKAHKLKSSVGLLQMDELLQTITKIEQDAKNRQWLDEIPALIDKAIDEYNLLQPMLEAERVAVSEG